jgi:hypothetical protein
MPTELSRLFSVKYEPKVLYTYSYDAFSLKPRKRAVEIWKTGNLKKIMLWAIWGFHHIANQIFAVKEFLEAQTASSRRFGTTHLTPENWIDMIFIFTLCIPVVLILQ